MAVYSFKNDQPKLPENNAGGRRYWIAPQAQVIGRVKIAQDVSIWYGAVVRGDNEWITIAAGTNIQDNAIAHSDEGSPLVIGSNCTIGHAAVVHGCDIHDNCLIGMGATVLNGAVIPENSIVAANALVKQNARFEKNSLIIGAPARVLRKLTQGEVKAITLSAKQYVKNWQNHLNNNLIKEI